MKSSDIKLLKAKARNSFFDVVECPIAKGFTENCLYKKANLQKCSECIFKIPFTIVSKILQGNEITADPKSISLVSDFIRFHSNTFIKNAKIYVLSDDFKDEKEFCLTNKDKIYGSIQGSYIFIDPKEEMVYLWHNLGKYSAYLFIIKNNRLISSLLIDIKNSYGSCIHPSYCKEFVEERSAFAKYLQDSIEYMNAFGEEMIPHKKYLNTSFVNDLTSLKITLI